MLLNELSVLERLDIIADILQVANYVLNITEVSNDDIMKALEEQNKRYLEIAIQQNKEIIERLERIEKNNNDKSRNVGKNWTYSGK